MPLKKNPHDREDFVRKERYFVGILTIVRIREREYAGFRYGASFYAALQFADRQQMSVHRGRLDYRALT